MAMENNVLNSLVLYKSKWFSDLVDESMLSNALMTKPHEVSTVLSYVFGRYEGNTVDFLTMGLGKTIEIDHFIGGMLAKNVAYKVGPDKAGAAGY